MDALTVDDDTVDYAFHHDTAFPTTTTVSRSGTTSVSQTRAYDRRGRLDSINASGGTTTLFSAAQTFDDHGRVARITLDGGVYWDYGYDDMGQLIAGAKKHSGGTVLPGYTFGYGFDTIGNRDSATRESTSEAYTPNLLNQITSIDHGGLLHLLGTADASAPVLVDGGATTRSGDLFYGPVDGNNTFESFAILGTLTGAGDGGSDAVARFDREAYIPAGATARTHDASGNLIEDAEWLYTWDAENRLVQMETRPAVVAAGAPHRRLTFEYDSQSRRTNKTVEQWDTATSSFIIQTSSLFLWNDWLLSAELEADTFEPIRSYTWGLDLAGTRGQTGGVGGLALVKHHKNGEVSVPLYTTNGNVRAYWELDADELVAEFEYGPFGESIRATGREVGKHPFRFSTKYEDAETGLLYYGYRFFDPQAGRWLSRDPIEEDGGLNLYAFVGNDGVNAWDYLGMADIIDPGVIAPPLPWDPKRCDELANEINDLRDEMAKRIDELKRDPNNLYETRPIGEFSYEGHIRQADGKQKRLRRLLKEYDSLGCKNGGGSPLVGDAWRYSVREIPIKPSRSYNREIAIGGGVLVAGYALYCLSNPVGWATLGGTVLFTALATD